jgi:hypothetical protein
MIASDKSDVPAKYLLVPILLGVGVWGAVAVINHSFEHEYPFHTPILAEMALPRGSVVVAGSCTLVQRTVSQFGCDFDIPEPGQQRTFLMEELPKQGWRVITGRPLWSTRPDWMERAQQSSELVTLCRGTDVLWVFWSDPSSRRVTAVHMNGVTLPCE